MLNVVLVEPEIPANTGNIGRTCVLTGAHLHLVGPLGFNLDDKAVQRAGLGYWQSLHHTLYRSWDEFLASSGMPWNAHTHLLTKIGSRTYADATYAPNDWLVFGKESSGLAQELLDAHPTLCERIPMLPDAALSNQRAWNRRYEELHPHLRHDICGNVIDERQTQISSLNLSNAVAIVLYEAWGRLGFPGAQARDGRTSTPRQ